MTKFFAGLSALFMLLFSSFSGFASGNSEGKFNAGEMIMHHIQDAHEIHIIGDFAIYLPVILKSEKGFEVFCSSHFYHNKKTAAISVHENQIKNIEYFEHNGFALFHEKIYYTNEQGELDFDEHGHPTNQAVTIDLSITKNTAGLLFALLIVTLVFLSVAKAYKKNVNKAPKGLQSFMEPLILFIRDEVAKPSIGHKYHLFMPFLLTIFFFIWTCNILGLIPFLGGLNITGTLSVTAVLATVVFVITSINGNKHYWGHLLWPPGIPLPIKFILVPIEIAGIFIKPLVLMVRLTANITAGHIIILAFVCLIFIFGEQSATAGYGVGVGSLFFMIFMNFIELLVAFLQAYVFTLLAAIYFGSAVEEAHH
ncbi:F-type H+-transporting ATPase subunit a [Flavobacteriales bacterium]|nr:F-type H+-transporting ATPase subunit a [Flavobacteriales bacterium]